jgi:threonine/homoserine/homoserine lactone efflux protein
MVSSRYCVARRADAVVRLRHAASQPPAPFTLLSFALIVVPGPNVIFVVTRSLMLGRAAGVGSALGGVAGEYVQVMAVALGIGASLAVTGRHD